MKSECNEWCRMFFTLAVFVWLIWYITASFASYSEKALFTANQTLKVAEQANQIQLQQLEYQKK